MTGTLLEDQYTLISLSPSQNEKCFGQSFRGSHNTHFFFSNFFRK